MIQSFIQQQLYPHQRQEFAVSDQIRTLHISYSFFAVEDDFYSLLVCIFSKNQKLLINRPPSWKNQTDLIIFFWIICFIFLLGISKSCKITDRGNVLATLQIFLTGNLYYFNVVYSICISYSLYHNYIFSHRSFKNKNYTILHLFS